MLLFALCLNPLIRTLEQNLTGMQIGSRRTKATVVAYADDATVFFTSPADIPKIKMYLPAMQQHQVRELISKNQRR